MRFNELIVSVRGDVAIKLHGDDLDKMSASAANIVNLLRSILSAADTKAEQTSGSPTLDVRFNRASTARSGLSIKEVADTLAAAMGEREAGLVFEGDRRFTVAVRVPTATRDGLDALRSLPVLLPMKAGECRGSIPLAQVAIPVQ